MLKIRLFKPGKNIKNKTHYKIVVIEEKKARDSRFVVELGHYDPVHDLFKMDTAKYDEWYKKGARPSQTIASLVKKAKKSIKA